VAAKTISYGLEWPRTTNYIGSYSAWQSLLCVLPQVKALLPSNTLGTAARPMLWYPMYRCAVRSPIARSCVSGTCPPLRCWVAGNGAGRRNCHMPRATLPTASQSSGFELGSGTAEAQPWPVRCQLR